MASSSGKGLDNWSPAITPRRMFSLRIVNLDYYMTPPLPGMDVCYSEFQGRGVREVPVVRIFGSTISGQRTCLHLHKSFPYFYVTYDSELPQEVNEALAFVRRLASSIEKAMKMASNVHAKRQHLHSCSLVRGKKYYGYHPNELLFIKIVLYYPQEVSRVSTLLLSGGLMNHKFQPHEAHFPYLLQILIDHNLCGMGHLHLSSLKFRNPLPEAPSDLMSSVKRVKSDFTHQEAIPQVDTAAVDHIMDYCSLKEGLFKKQAVSTSPLSPKRMEAAPREVSVRPFPSSRSSSPSSHHTAFKEEALNVVPPSRFPPTVHLTTIKEEPFDKAPLPQSSSPAYQQTTMNDETLREVHSTKSSTPAFHVTTVKEETSNTLPPSTSRSPAFCQTLATKEDVPMLAVHESAYPSVHQINTDGGSQTEIWLQKSVPGDWIWPLLASDNMEIRVQAQGLYSRQSTCELEADASVEDILNRSELLFLPLQDAGPEMKMVQSLTPMWEEERARSGEGGPAGSIDPLYQPTPRTVPIPSPFEKAMRETLFQIARAEEQELVSKKDSQGSTQQSGSGSGTEPVMEICTLLGSQHELKISLGSAGDSAGASDEDETDERRRSSEPVDNAPDTLLDSRLKSTQTGLDLAPPINEELIRKQLSQRCMSQDLDKEVAEFLRWMGTTQLDFDDQEDGGPDSKDGEMGQMALSQMFSSPGMDAALLKALADYENATEQECQAILDCADPVDEREEDEVEHNNVNEYSCRAQVEGEGNERAHTPHQSRTKNDGKRAPPFIPQTDGAGDEYVLESERDRSPQSFSSKRPRHDISRDDSTRSGRQEVKRRHKREISLRDMMRKRRERRPGRKDVFSPSSSVLEGVSSEAEPVFPKSDEAKIPSSDGKQQRLRKTELPQLETMQMASGEDSPRSEDLSATTSGGKSLERAYRRKGKVVHKSESVNNFFTSKFGALPVVTLKYDTADVNCRVEHLLEKDPGGGCESSFRESQGVTERKSKVELPAESSSEKSVGKKFIQKVTFVEEMAAVQSRGDDRDCGGGQTSFGSDLDSLSPAGVSVAYVNSSGRDRGMEIVEVQSEPDGNRADYEPEVHSSDGHDCFLAQTQFPSVTLPLNPQSSQLYSESMQVDVEKHDNVQGPDALMMSHYAISAVPKLNPQNEIERLDEKQESVVNNMASENSDCFRPSQVMKPDVSYMTELRPSEFEKYVDNVRVELQDVLMAPAEQTQVLSPFIPFLDSRYPSDRPDHVVKIEGLGREDEDDEGPGQTQILELQNLHVNDIPQTMLIEYVRDVEESFGADEDDAVCEQTQVVNLEATQMTNCHPLEPGPLPGDVVEDAAEHEGTAVLEVSSTQNLKLRRGESSGCVQGIEGQGYSEENGHAYRPTQKLELHMSYADVLQPVHRAKIGEEVKADGRSEKSRESGDQTRILSLFTAGGGRTSVGYTNRKVDFSDSQIPKVVEAEMTSTPSTRLPVETTGSPHKVEPVPRFDGERELTVGDATSPAYATETLDGTSHQATDRTQYLFYDMSDDSEASYDSEEDRWCKDDVGDAADLFGEHEIGISGGQYGRNDQVEEGFEVVERDSGWDDADEKVFSPLTEVQKEDVHQMDGLSAADEDAAKLASPESRGVHSTQYLFTDMSDDSETSYDSETDCKEILTAEEFFAEEEKAEVLGGAEDGGPFRSETERKSGLTMADSEGDHVMPQEQNCSETNVQKSLHKYAFAEIEGQNSALAIAECSGRNDSENPDPLRSSFKLLSPLEAGTTGNSEVVSGGSGRITSGALRSSPASALVPFLGQKVDQQFVPMIFHQRPPTREQITESFKEIVCNFKEDSVFYGNVKDVSDHPVVRAGLIFDVKSREAIHLRPFHFGRLGRRSNFDSGSKHREHIQQESWGYEERLELMAGIPTYTENNGTTLYIITPARAPPSPRAVKQWLSLQSVQHLETSEKTAAGGQQFFTMDPNTGKLVPVTEIGSVTGTQKSTPTIDNSQEDREFVRPASPKYDEKHVFFLSHSATISSSHGLSLRRSASKCGDDSAPADQGRRSPQGMLCLAPYPIQTSSLLSSTLADVSDGKLLPQKNLSSALPVYSREKELVKRNLAKDATTKAGKQWRDVSQMTAFTAATTPLSQAGFRDPASCGLGQQITLMSIEVFAETRGELLPDPRYDAIGCIVLVFHEDSGRSGSTDVTVVLIRDEEAHSSRRYPDGIQGCELIYLPDEKALFKCFVQLVRLCDPDMLIGWEVQGFSLGLLAERAANLGISLLKQLSRTPPVSNTSTEPFEKEIGNEDQPDAALFDRVPEETIGVDEPIIDDEWGRTHGSGLYVGGRTVLNAWRIMRGEVKLNIYSIEAVAEAVLRRRVPRLPWQTLTRCFVRGPSGGRYHCIEYFIKRAKLTLEIMEQLDLINRTSELARVFGIDFYSVFSRGSQFRVESMMARLAHTQNYLLLSPTRQQVAEQPGMQCLPLVMEPESRFYNSPVIVLDFQSLYPSMIIAYNLCFSTCLGKLSAENPKVLGVTNLKLDPGILSGLKESMTITPNGIMFAPKEVLPGVLPRLLQEILSTRIMVKKAMKALSPDQRVLERVLNARQFALKLIANVTYGYTAAGFSGRMPCAEIADSIVQCGRLTLERAINMVNSHPRWNARVVYGDTDSMFVLCEGRSKDEAFRIGQEIATSVTEANPPPVTLKMEKVYLPCVLLTKKRYVGYSFESPSQVKPRFDAKGIETIRRDTCPAVAKALEHSIRILFETQDLSQVKQYLQRQWGKILSGRISIQDFIFAKEVRLGTYSARSPVLPPAAIVASKAMAVDPRAEPRYAERIPYVVVHGEPGARLVDMVVDPLTLVSQPSLRLHDTYYITKQIIPACQRIFMLVGVDLRAWFSEMPKVYRPPTSKRVSNLMIGAKSTRWDPEAGKFRRGQSLRHGTIDQYFLSRHCTICGEFTRASQLLCDRCLERPVAAAIMLPGRTARLQKEFKHLEAICRHCGGGDGSPEGSIACIALECSVFFERRKVHRELIAAGAVSSDLGYYPPCLPELF